jgi:putative glutamine amidotransferase
VGLSGPVRDAGGAVVLGAGVPRESQVVVEALESLGVGRERQRVFHSADGIGGAAEAVAGAAGLVLCGGADVHPSYYGEEVLPWARVAIEPRRDEMEWAMLEAAREARVPVWGICRGIQVLNVFLGGSLWQDLPTQVSNSMFHHLSAPTDALIHTVEVTPEGRGTALGEVLAREPALVNSRHHQAVKGLAPGLVPVAVTADGLVEAVVLADGGWWVEALEWHPENLMPMPQQRAVAQRFVDAVERRDRG